MVMIAYSLSGLFFAAFCCYGLVTLAKLLSLQHSGEMFFALLLFIGACFTLQVFFPMPFLGHIVLCGLAFVAARGFSGRVLPRWNLIGFCAAFVLAIDALYAALPRYRYDQWNYHLIIPKLMDAENGLPKTIFYDHIYFTGVYEFFFTFFRVVSSNDTFIQSATNSFSWLAIFTCLYLPLQSKREQLLPNSVSALPMAAFGFFAILVNESFINAKPDSLLFPAAFLWLVHLNSCLKGQRESWLWLGFFMSAPLALKVSWLQFVLVQGILGIVYVRPLWRQRDTKYFLLGLLLGFLLFLPVAVKNFIFFGNPLHPAQQPLWPSLRWNDDMAWYWENVRKKAQSLPMYFEYQWQNLVYFVPRTWLYWLPWTFLLFIPKFRGAVSQFRREFVIFFISLVSFYLLWPVFFEPGVETRFITPLFGVLFFASCFLAQSVKVPHWVLSAVLLLPLVYDSGVERKLKELAKSAFLSREEFYAKFSPHLRDGIESLSINLHRQQNYATAKMNEKIVLTDVPSAYFLDALAMSMDGYDFRHYYNAHQDLYKSCPEAFFARFDVAYVYDHLAEKQKWPELVKQVIPQLEGLDELGKTFFVPEQVRQKGRQCLTSNQENL